ncbi:MAG: DUF2298 domain-containing protein [Methanomicrobiales archaeon]|jgi:YYY domain-containing protein|nr:DUF2298 domain-containing protein [Methanomicrobiales archaeon]
MIEIEHLLFVCAWLITYFVLQLCTWLILRVYVSPALAFPASFAVSLLWSCLISWYLAWLGFSPVYALGIFFILTGIVLGGSKEARIRILSDLKDGKWYYALFFTVFLTFLLVRMFYPDIYVGIWEKFMNHAFIASMMRTPIVPPLDPWYAGGTLEVYYYLGHWCFATLGSIAHIPSWIVFQLIIPTIASISAVQLYGIGKLVSKKFSLTPVLVLFIVNPAFLFFYLTKDNHYNLFWDSIYVMQEGYTEYPLFTFILGDPHAHALGVFNQVFFLLMVVYLCTRWQKLINAERAMCALLAGISLGTMVGMNVWNAFSSAPLFLLAAIVIWYQTHSGKEQEPSSGVKTWIYKVWTYLYGDIVDLLKKRSEISHSSAVIVYLWILVPLIAFLSYAPFFIMMNPAGAQGIGIVHTKTMVSDFFLAFGWFLFLFLCTLYADIKKQPKLLLIGIPFIIVGYPLIGLVLVLFAYLIARRGGVFDLLFASGLFLVLLCELVYIIDSLDWGASYRVNTIWKIYHVVWLLLGVGALCSASIHLEEFINRAYRGKKRAIVEKYSTRLVTGGILVLILSVPILNYEFNPTKYSEIQGLDGLAWMEKAHPDDYAAVMYLHELPGEHVLVAAAGDFDQNNQFDQYNTRISSVTGIPSILGVSSHELTWRGSNPPGWYQERRTDISTIYEQPKRAFEIMKKYNANLLILGDSERKMYQIPDDTSAYLSDLVPVFTAGQTMIYQLASENERCADGYAFVDGECYPLTGSATCADGYTLVDGRCYPLVGKPTCADEYAFVDGECYPLAGKPTCADGYTLVDDLCHETT